MTYEKKFLPIFERKEATVYDSSAMSDARFCLRYYFYKDILGFKSMEVPPYFTFGTAIHKFYEIICGQTKNDFVSALEGAVKIWEGAKINPAAFDGKFDFMTGPRLLLTCRKLWDWHQRELAQGKIKVKATEQVLITTIPGTDIKVGGRADQVATWDFPSAGATWGRDLKTTSKGLDVFERQLTPNDQFTRYTYLEGAATGERVHGQMVLVVRNTKKEGPQIHQFVTSRTDWEMSEWVKEQIAMHNTLERCRESDIWPMASFYKQCNYCEYRSVCSQGSEAGMVTHLKQNFKQEWWDFTKLTEGD